MEAKVTKRRMTGAERREQLIEVARGLFAEKGLDGTSVEEIAATAEVSKPVVYEHFGGKEGLYAVVVDREVTRMLDYMRAALSSSEDYRVTLEQATLAVLSYIDEHTHGFRIIMRDRRDQSEGNETTSYNSIIGDIGARVDFILEAAFENAGIDVGLAEMYSQMLIGMISQVGLWWLETREPAKEVVAAHVVNLAWFGLPGLQADPPILKSITSTEG